MSFQENLRYYREKAGYKQAKEFAKILDISYSTYKGYESQGREPKYETLCKIADLLEVSTDELLGRTNNILGNNESEKLEKIIKDLLNEFNTENNLKLFNTENSLESFKPKIEKQVKNYVSKYIDFEVCNSFITFIKRETLINKVNSFDVFAKNIRDKLLYYYILRYTFERVSLDLNSSISSFEKDCHSGEYKNNIKENEHLLKTVLNVKNIDEIIEKFNEFYKDDRIKQNKINEIIKTEHKNLLVLATNFMDYLKNIDMDIMQKAKEDFNVMKSIREENNK